MKLSSIIVEYKDPPSTNELVKGFLKTEIKAKNRKQGVAGDQGAEEQDVRDYILSLGYDEAEINELFNTVSAAPEEEKPAEEELSTKQQSEFAQLQKHIKGGAINRSQLKLLMRELSR